MKSNYLIALFFLGVVFVSRAQRVNRWNNEIDFGPSETIRAYLAEDRNYLYQSRNEEEFEEEMRRWDKESK